MIARLWRIVNVGDNMFHPSGSISRPSDALLDLMSRAFEAREELLVMTRGDIDAMTPRHRRHLERTAKLGYLAPDIVLAILDGRPPSHLSARKLVRAAAFPIDWAARCRILLAEKRAITLGLYDTF